jgi:hypothetical protein
MQKEPKPNVITCLKHKKQFTDYEYQSVSWSGDSLPVCPLCRLTPYDKEFDKLHIRAPHV